MAIRSVLRKIRMPASAQIAEAEQPKLLENAYINDWDPIPAHGIDKTKLIAHGLQALPPPV